MTKPKCKFGNDDTCDGIDGTTGFICNDCVEDAEFDTEKRAEQAKIRGEGRPSCELIEEDLTARKPFDAGVLRSEEFVSVALGLRKNRGGR